MDEGPWNLFEATKGFMSRDEGRALHEAALAGASNGPLIEIGSYCGRSTVLLAEAARRAGTILFTIDHHHGSEEHQPGEEYHDAVLWNHKLNRIDTLPHLLDTIESAGASDVVATIVGRSAAVATTWNLPVGLVFLDGGHGEETAQADYEGWAPHVMLSGLLVIHDVFEDPNEGGRPPYNVFHRALDSGAFEERTRAGSLRVLARIGDGI